MKKQFQHKVTESTAWWMVRPLVDREDIIKHVKDNFIALYPKKSGSGLLQITLSFLASRRIEHLDWKKSSRKRRFVTPSLGLEDMSLD